MMAFSSFSLEVGSPLLIVCGFIFYFKESRNTAPELVLFPCICFSVLLFVFNLAEDRNCNCNRLRETMDV